MGVALRKNSHRGYHDFLPPSRCPSLRLVPGTNQEIGTAKVRPSSVALVEYNGNNQLLARYTHSGLRTDDVLAADITSDGVSAGLAQNTGSYQYLKDAQGTVTDVADSSGNKLQQYVYSAFGELLGIKDAYGADVSAAPPVRTSYSYTGREYDSESGMLYYRARYYMPEIGRFVQADPEPGRLEVPISMSNRYSYVGNNSVNLNDPSGEFWEQLFGVVRFALHWMNPLELPQNLVTVVFVAAWFVSALAMPNTGEPSGVEFRNGVLVFRGGFMTALRGKNAWKGVTPSGTASFVSAGNDKEYEKAVTHETKHTWQSTAYGFSYLPLAISISWQDDGCNWFEKQADPKYYREQCARK